MIGTNASETVDPTDAGLLVFGNEGRAASSEGLVGLIDEVRISNTARTADQFIFQVPEPASAGLLGLGGLALLGKRRRSRS